MSLCQRRDPLWAVLGVLFLSLGRPLGAQVLPSPLAPAHPAPIVYCPPERLAAGAASVYHVLNVFLPVGTAPAQGWPVVVSTGYGGGSSSPPFNALSSSGGTKPLWDLVAAGIAVVHFGTPGLGGNSRGLWYPPGHPTGRWESFRPVHDNPEKSAVWALQWVKVQTSFPFDLARVGLRGSSGGAVLAIRTAMGPERARLSGSSHVRASTRVAAILALQPPTSAWALEQGPELTIAFPKHFEQAANPGVAATELSQVEPALQKAYSLMGEAFTSGDALANNARQPLCLVYGDPVLRVGGQPATFALDTAGFPVLYDAIRQPLQHDSWFGYVFWKRLLGLSSESAAFHAAHSVFAMRDLYALPPPNAVHTQVYSGTVFGARATKIGHDFLVKHLRGGLPFRATAPTPGGAPPRVASSVAPRTPRRRELDWTAEGAASGTLVLPARQGEVGWWLVGRALDPGESTGSGQERVTAVTLVRAAVLEPHADGYARLPLELEADGPLHAQVLILGPQGRLELTNVATIVP